MTHRWEVPSVEAYCRAFEAIRRSVNVDQLLMLEAHFRAPGHRVRAIDLARAAGYSSHVNANRVYPALGKLLREHFQIPRSPEEVFVEIFVHFPKRPNSRARWVFELREPVVAALTTLGWFEDSDWDGGSDEELQRLAYKEGGMTTSLRTQRKREKALRWHKIQLVLDTVGRLVCEVPGCGFDFAFRYGTMGKKFAEVHHLTPLSAGESVRDHS